MDAASANLKVLKWFGIMSVVFVVGCSTISLLRSGHSESVVSSHRYIGRTFIAGDQAYYMERCKNKKSCANTKRMVEIDRSMECGARNLTLTRMYENSYDIGEDVKFKIIELIEIEPRGIQSAFSSPVVVAVLRDSNGIVSTTYFSFSLSSEPYLFKNGEVCSSK